LSLIIENKPQRQKLYTYLASYLKQAENDNHHTGLLFLKIRDLRQLEINIGYDALELISKKIQARLLFCMKTFELVLPIALDTFVIIIPKVLNQGHSQMIAERLLREVQAPIKTSDDTVKLTPIVGIASTETASYDEKELYLNALIAFESGNANDASCTIYDAEFKRQMKKIWNVKKDIDLAIHDNQFELFFQPKIDLKRMTVCGAEALIRWFHPQHGMISPLEFIPIAEESGQIHSITEWVVKSALQYLSQILQEMPEFVLSINICANDLDSPELIFLVEDSLSIWNVPAENLVIEVTESTIMRDAKSTLQQLEKIRRLGVGISIDDFGTGYSSLAYFKKIPATELKIDKSFVDNLLENSSDRHIVSLIIFLARRFDLKVVAEGIEVKEVLEEICNLQADYAQGFYFSKPLCYEDFMKWCETF